MTEVWRGRKKEVIAKQMDGLFLQASPDELHKRCSEVSKLHPRSLRPTGEYSAWLGTVPSCAGRRADATVESASHRGFKGHNMAQHFWAPFFCQPELQGFSCQAGSKEWEGLGRATRGRIEGLQKGGGGGGACLGLCEDV